MKVTQMLPVHEANLVANSGNAAFGVDVIVPFHKDFSPSGSSSNTAN